MGKDDVNKIVRENIESGMINDIPFNIELIGLNLDGGTVIAETSVTGKDLKESKASASKDGSSKDEYNPVSSKKVKITIDENDDGCDWAYEHDDSTFCAIKKACSLVNTPLQTKVAKKFTENAQVNGLLEKFNAEVPLILQSKIDSIVTYSYVNSRGFLKKLLDTKGKLAGCIALKPSECKPIRDLSTGELGGKLGLGLDGTRKNKEIAVIQKGHPATYDGIGNVIHGITYYYFTRKEIIPFTINDRGKFSGVSPVWRMLRQIEVRRTYINIAEMVLRRFGPQIIVTVGNKDVNFSGSEIPAAYMKDSDGLTRDRATAKAAYRKAVMTKVKEKIVKWADTDTLVHIQEYGYDVSTLNPSSALPDYIRYIESTGRQIKYGILGIFVEGRVDITSATMQESISRDLKDSAMDMRNTIITILNQEYVNHWLEDNELPKNSIYLEFEPLDKTSEKDIASVEKVKSEIIRNYSLAGYEVPKEVLEVMGLQKLIKVKKILPKPIGNNDGNNNDSE